MGTFIVKESGTAERDGLPVPFKPWPLAPTTTLFTRRIPFIICTGNMLGDLVRYLGIVPLKELKRKQKTKRRLFYAAKKRYTRCLVKKCGIPVHKIDQCGKRCKKQLDCVKKHCLKEDDAYSQAAFL
jgi:hypothetical protein